MMTSNYIRAAIAVVIPILYCTLTSVGSADEDTATSNVAIGEPSVLVKTTAPRRGAIPDIITTYGSATHGSNATRNIVLRREVEIRRIAVEPGQSVRAGDVLAEVATTPMAAANFQQAVTAYTLATAQRAHAAQLRAQQLATKDQLAQAIKGEADARAQLDALKRSGADRSGETIRASCDGVVSAIAVAQGDQVQPNAPLFTLGCDGATVVAVGLEPGDEARVRTGQKVRLEPLAHGPAIEGTVGAVGGMIDPRTHLVPSVIHTPAQALPGANYRALITVGEISGWLVPRDAVLSDVRGFYVFEVMGNKAHRIEIKPLGTFGNMTAVTGALTPNHPVVTSGNYQLDDGMAVRAPQDGAN